MSSERAAVVDCEDRNEDTRRRLGEPEPFPSFLPALPIDRNRRMQLVERRFGTASSPGVTYGEDLRRSVHEWIHEALKARGVKDEIITARLPRDDLDAEISQRRAPLKSEVDFDRALLISL